MMSTIWKYEFNQDCIITGGFGYFKAVESFNFEIPQGHKVLSVGMQNGKPCMWVELDKLAWGCSYTFLKVGTGQDIPEDIKKITLEPFKTAILSGTFTR